MYVLDVATRMWDRSPLPKTIARDHMEATTIMSTSSLRQSLSVPPRLLYYGGWDRHCHTNAIQILDLGMALLCSPLLPSSSSPLVSSSVLLFFRVLIVYLLFVLSSLFPHIFISSHSPLSLSRSLSSRSDALAACSHLRLLQYEASFSSEHLRSR